MTINPSNCNQVFVSEQVNGVFEIIQYELNDGKIESRIPLTSNSEKDNVRPFFPRNMKAGDRPMLLQNERYVHYTNYSTHVLYRYLNK